MLLTLPLCTHTNQHALLTPSFCLPGICAAREQELILVPGLGDKKVKRLYQALHEPFRAVKQKAAASSSTRAIDSSSISDSNSSSSSSSSTKNNNSSSSSSSSSSNNSTDIYTNSNSNSSSSTIHSSTDKSADGALPAPDITSSAAPT